MEIRCVYTEGNQNVIQEAVDRLPASGGTVIVPRGEWKSGAIHLKSNVKLYLEEGCVIHFSSCMEDYLPPVFTRWEGVECYNYSSLIYAADCENVTICGTGVLDGAGSAWWHWKKLQQNAADRLIRAESQGIVVEERVFATREDALRPSFIQFINCKHVTLEDFTIEDGPQWTIHPVYCEDVVVRGVTVNTKGPNTDGCNPDSCRKVLIEDCTFETGDDCIAINSGMNEDGWRVGRPCEQIEVKNCRFIGGHAAVAIGSGMSGSRSADRKKGGVDALMNLWQKGKRRMLRSVRIRSLKDTSLRLGTPVFLVLMGLVVCLLWGVWENRKLADKYIADTAKLYVDQINRDMSQINSELIYLLDSDSNIKEIPDQITSTDAQYYEMEQTLRERNRVLKIRYHEIQTFFVYGQKANVLITDSGTMFTESKGMTTLNQMLMSYLQIMTSKDSISTQWTVITFGDDDYIVGWYAKNKKVIGCVINLNLIFRTIRAKTEEYDVIPFMVDARGRVMTQADTSEKYKNEIIDFSKAGKKKEKNATVYSYQLGTVGKINLMVLPGGGILENVLIMQIAFVVLIAVLLLVCALEITAYYHRILEPLEKFGQKLEELEKEQSLNDDGSNNLLELESVSGKFKELLRKIQGLKIAIYEKELAEQKAELEYTQEQIKPHFFLNCLSLIHGIADKNNEGEIVEITTVLSDYMRYIFQDSKKQRDVE